MESDYQHVNYRVQDGVFCVRLKNRKLPETALQELNAELDRLIDGEGCCKMVLSLGPGDLACLYSVFLGQLVALQRRLTNMGGAVVIAEATDNTQGVFRTTGLDKHFKFYADPATAVASFA